MYLAENTHELELRRKRASNRVYEPNIEAVAVLNSLARATQQGIYNNTLLKRHNKMTATHTSTAKTYISIETAAESIEAGEFDEHLEKLERAVAARLGEVRRKRSVDDFMISQTVRFNSLCGTGYLRGQTAVVTGKSRKKLTVVLDRPVGRFVRVVDGISTSVDVTVPPSIVDPA